MKKLLILALIFISNLIYAQEYEEGIFVTGAVFNKDSVMPLPDAVIRNQSNGLTYGVNDNGRFSISAHIGDTLTVTHIGYIPVQVILDNSIISTDALVGIFMVQDTIMLSEVVILPRINLTYRSNTYLQNAKANMNSAVDGALTGAGIMDRDANLRYVMNGLARSVEDKGMVDVGFTIGTQSYEAIKDLIIQRRIQDRRSIIDDREVNLLINNFFIRKGENYENE